MYEEACSQQFVSYDESGCSCTALIFDKPINGLCTCTRERVSVFRVHECNEGVDPLLTHEYIAVRSKKITAVFDLEPTVRRSHFGGQFEQFFLLHGDHEWRRSNNICADFSTIHQIQGDETGVHYREFKRRTKRKSMHSPGIEPGSPAWQADIIPLDHECEKITKFGCPTFSHERLFGNAGTRLSRCFLFCLFPPGAFALLRLSLGSFLAGDTYLAHIVLLLALFCFCGGRPVLFSHLPIPLPSHSVCTFGSRSSVFTDYLFYCVLSL